MNDADHQQNWIEFFENFQINNQIFIRTLSTKYPDLSRAQFRVCAYLRAGYDTKSIAKSLNLSVRSVESHCYRIRKRFDLNHTDNLATYLYSFR
jgi:DNA-binding CsgD family transcriptional regulator